MSFWIMTIPVLSTGHVEQATMDLLQSRPEFTTVACYDIGAFVVVQDETYDDVPPDLEAIFVWARQQGHQWIRLDPDGDHVGGLPTYDW